MTKEIKNNLATRKRRSPQCHKFIVSGKIMCVYPRSREKKWMKDKTIFKGIEIKKATRVERKEYLKRNRVYERNKKQGQEVNLCLF